MGILETDTEVDELVGSILWCVGRLGVVVVVSEDGDACWLDMRFGKDSGDVCQGEGEGCLDEWIAR